MQDFSILNDILEISSLRKGINSADMFPLLPLTLLQQTLGLVQVYFD